MCHSFYENKTPCNPKEPMKQAEVKGQRNTKLCVPSVYNTGKATFRGRKKVPVEKALLRDHMGKRNSSGKTANLQVSSGSAALNGISQT